MHTIRAMILAGTGIWLAVATSAWADDWPMWRYDAGRTAASSEELPQRLHLQWTMQFSPRVQVWDDPLNHDLMPYDKVLEPIVMGDRMFIGFNDADKVIAVDARSGKELWAFYTDGPVRLPPVGWKENVYFCSDDGYLYCVNATDGRLRWRFRGGPSDRKVIGNGRVVSAWPARGGPVIRDGRIYFAASIWPFMGTFIYALDAETGNVEWLNDETAAQYIKQPHGAPSFAGVAPQGALVATKDVLLVPGGRSVPAAFDRHTGKFMYFHINDGGKGNGGSFVIGNDSRFYAHTRYRGVRSYDLKTGDQSDYTNNEPVLAANGLIYAADLKKVEVQGERDDGKNADDDKEEEDANDAEEKDQKKVFDEKPVIRAIDPNDIVVVKTLIKKKSDEEGEEDTEEEKEEKHRRVVWELEADGRGDIIQAGNHLYAAGKESLIAIRLPENGEEPKIVWSQPVDGEVVRLLAANGRLFAVTLDGRIMAFGDDEDDAGTVKRITVPLSPSDTALQQADHLLEQAGADEGYSLWFGADDLSLLEAVVDRSAFQIVVVDPDEQRVDRLRRHFDDAGVYGTRISVHVGDPFTFQAPPYIAHLVVVGRELADRLNDKGFALAVYASVRPYGGTLQVLGSPRSLAQLHQSLREADLENAAVSPGVSNPLVVTRVGPLVGAADWTHQYGNIANTVKSDDRRVKLPLGLLWFGGSSNMDVLPRHSHGPPEQVIGGRAIVEGMNSLSARDVYTGRVLWKHEFDDLGTFDIYFDTTYEDTPLDTAYNQVHIPGANGRGVNYVATEDLVYVVVGKKCEVLDVATGEHVFDIEMPQDPSVGDERLWGYIGVYRDILLGGAGFANYRKRRDVSFEEEDKELKDSAKGFGSKSYDVSASLGLVAFDRHTGKVLWKVDSRHSFPHNGIVAGNGKVFCLDKLPQPVEDKLRRRGQAFPDTYRILALDSQTGQTAWEVEGGIFGTWLSYSEPRDILLEAGADASDRLKSEVGAGMATYRGNDGSLVWRKDDLKYNGPCILHNDTILTNANSYSYSAGAFSLLDGSPKLIENPLTGEMQPWKITRAYGCNNIIASENLLTFRSGAAGFFDLQSLSGTGNLGGFKSSCTSNLVVANGVLNAPDYTRTCSCAYQNQTSLALIHMPELDMWTVNSSGRIEETDVRIKRIGVNLGAPGDRRAPDGTLWLEYPNVGGDSPARLAIKVEGNEATYYYDQFTSVTGPAQPWVVSSGAKNVESIEIGMKTLPPEGEGIAVSHAHDDAEEKADGSVSLNSGDLELVEDSSPQLVGLRFTGIELRPDAKIGKATIQFTSHEESESPAKLLIQAEASANGERFTAETHDISSRKRTESFVEWEPKEWKEKDKAEEDQRTPDLAPLIHEVIQRPGWEVGNSLVFIISGEGGKRVAKAYKEKSTGAPKLVLEDVEQRPIPKPGLPEKPHTVRLYFAECDRLPPGQRVFDIEFQGQTVLPDFDVAREAGEPNRSVVLEFGGVMIGDALDVSFRRKVGTPIISGVEVIAEE